MEKNSMIRLRTALVEARADWLARAAERPNSANVSAMQHAYEISAKIDLLTSLLMVSFQYYEDV